MQCKHRKHDDRAERDKTPRRKLPRVGRGAFGGRVIRQDVEAARDEHRPHDHDGVKRCLQKGFMEMYRA